MSAPGRAGGDILVNNVSVHVCIIMYTRVCVHVYTCVYVCMYTHVFVYTYICIYVCMYVCMYICVQGMCVCKKTPASTCVCLRVYRYMCTFVHVYIHVCMCIVYLRPHNVYLSCARRCCSRWRQARSQ